MSNNKLVDKTYPYPMCVDCQNPIMEGHIYKCGIEGCGNSVCLNCINMVSGLDICNACYAKDYVGYMNREGFD